MTVDTPRAVPDPHSLAARRVLVLGGTSGIGLASAGRAIALGADVTVAGRDPARLDAAVDGLPGAHGRQVDATDPAALTAALDELRPRHVVVSTSVSHTAPAAEIDVEDAVAWLRGRVVPVLTVARWAARNAGELESLTIVSGYVVRRGTPGLAMWGLVGPGIIGMAEQLAVELGPTRVNVVSPGFVGDSARALEHYAGGDEAVAERTRVRLAATNPARRSVTLDDVARQVVGLMTDPVLTGTVRTTDAGQSLL